MQMVRDFVFIGGGSGSVCTLWLPLAFNIFCVRCSYMCHCMQIILPFCLYQVSVLIVFTLLIMAIIGLEMYKGVFHHACFALDANGTRTDRLYGDHIPCTPRLPPRMGAHACPKNVSECGLYWEGPRWGIVSFDNFGNALVTVFQVSTMEG